MNLVNSICSKIRTIRGIILVFSVIAVVWWILLSQGALSSQNKERKKLLSVDQTTELLTIAIKYFHIPNSPRTKLVHRLVSSIRDRFNEVRVLLANDGKKLSEEDMEMLIKQGVIVYQMSFDAGLSAGRNKMLKETKTKYLMILDEDMEFKEHSSVQTMVSVMEHYNLDIVGGAVENLPVYTGQFTSDNGTLNICVEHEKVFLGSTSCYLTHRVFNFFVGRTESLLQYPWDEELKLAEHTIFFFNAWKHKAKVAFCPNLEIGHNQVEDAEYAVYRDRADAVYWPLAKKKYHINDVTYNCPRVKRP